MFHLAEFYIRRIFKKSIRSRKAAVYLLFSFIVSISTATSIAEERGFMLETIPIVDYRLYEEDPRFDVIRADIDWAHSNHATIFRFPIYLDPWYAPDLTYWLALAHVAEYECWLRGCVLVIDLHSPSFDVFEHPDIFVSIWGVIADSFKSNGARVHYDLLNEPTTPRWGIGDKPPLPPPTPMNVRWEQWYSIANMAAAAIATYDRNPNHKIVFCCLGVNFEESSRWRPLTAVPQNRQWATAHGWVWNNAALSPNGAYPTATRTYARLATQIDAFKNIQLRYPEVRCFVGELGFHRDAPGCKAFLRDATAICRARNIHVCIHALNEDPRWDYIGTRAWPTIAAWLSAP